MSFTKPEKLIAFVCQTTDEILANMSAQERLKGLTAAERLEGLTVEERFQGLTMKEIVSALSPEMRVALLRHFETMVDC
jgi:hypothetical protein